ERNHQQGADDGDDDAGEEITDLLGGEPLGDGVDGEGQNRQDDQVDQCELEPTSGLPEQADREPGVDEDSLEDAVVDTGDKHARKPFSNWSRHHGAPWAFAQNIPARM